MSSNKACRILFSSEWFSVANHYEFVLIECSKAFKVKISTWILREVAPSPYLKATEETNAGRGVTYSHVTAVQWITRLIPGIFAAEQRCFPLFCKHGWPRWDCLPGSHRPSLPASCEWHCFLVWAPPITSWDDSFRWLGKTPFILFCQGSATPPAVW